MWTWWRFRKNLRESSAEHILELTKTKRRWMNNQIIIQVMTFDYRSNCTYFHWLAWAYWEEKTVVCNLSLCKVCIEKPSIVPTIFNNLFTILLILAGGGEWAERLTIHLNRSPFIDSHCIFRGENQGGFSPLLAEWRCDRPHGLRSSWVPGEYTCTVPRPGFSLSIWWHRIRPPPHHAGQYCCKSTWLVKE